MPGTSGTRHVGSRRGRGRVPASIRTTLIGRDRRYIGLSAADSVTDRQDGPPGEIPRRVPDRPSLTHNHAEPEDVAALALLFVPAEGGEQADPQVIAPTAAAEDPLLLLVGVDLVVAPLPEVAAQVEEAEPVGVERPDRGREDEPVRYP